MAHLQTSTLQSRDLFKINSDRKFNFDASKFPERKSSVTINPVAGHLHHAVPGGVTSADFPRPEM